MTPYPVTVCIHMADLLFCYPLTRNMTHGSTTTHLKFLVWADRENTSQIFKHRNSQLQCYSMPGRKLNSNPLFSLCLYTSFVFTNYQPRQCNASYNRAFIVDRSLSGIMTSKLVIRECESPVPAASSVLISRMTSLSVIIPYWYLQNRDKSTKRWLNPMYYY